MTEYVRSRSADVEYQDDLRRRSATIVTPEDVSAVDELLLAFVSDHRKHRSVVIDSHPVTKEGYGYRITPFSLEQFARLSPDEIWVLFVSPEVTRQRIADDPGGRPLVSEEEARMHTELQASVAATYGMSLGRAVYLFDASGPPDELVDRLAERLT